MTTRRRLLLIAAVLCGVLLVVGVWLGIRVAQAGAALQRLSDRTGPVLAALTSGDTAALAEELPALRTAAAQASSATGDPIVGLGSRLPWLGDDLRALTAVARAADTLTAEPAEALLDLTAALDTPGGDGLDLSAVAGAGPGLTAGLNAVAGLCEELAALDPAGLTGPVQAGVERLSPVLAADPAELRATADLAERLPGLLAAGGERRYLLLAMNPAELRSQGGIVGSVAVLTVTDGRVVLSEQRGTTELPELSGPALPLTGAETALYGDRLGRWIQDVVLSPDFPRAAALGGAYWEQTVGGRVDGVLATDPVALSAVLAAAGDTVRVDGQEVVPAELIGLLLRQAYLDHGDPRDGDAFHARTATAAFDALAGVLAEPQTLLAVAAALRDQVDDGRLRFWSADPAEQRVVAATPLAADFLSGLPEGEAAGVFLDDATAGKLGADLSVRTAVQLTGCGTARPTARITVTLDYRPPADIASYPAQVLGDGGTGAPAGWIVTNLSVYSARGEPSASIERDGRPIGGAHGEIDGRSVHAVTSRLAPDGAETYQIELPAPGGRLTLWTTPTIDAPGRVVADCALG